MITQLEWRSIRSMVERVVADLMGSRRDYFVTGKVIDRDELKNLIWLEEFGDQPIPIVAFNYKVKIYDESPRDTVYGAVGAAADYKVKIKYRTTTVVVPDVGETVLVARELGIRRLPRCLGVIQGRDWIISEDEA
jgi:hypothetical protein